MPCRCRVHGASLQGDPSSPSISAMNPDCPAIVFWWLVAALSSLTHSRCTPAQFSHHTSTSNPHSHTLSTASNMHAWICAQTWNCTRLRSSSVCPPTNSSLVPRACPHHLCTHTPHYCRTSIMATMLSDFVIVDLSGDGVARTFIDATTVSLHVRMVRPEMRMRAATLSK